MSNLKQTDMIDYTFNPNAPSSDVWLLYASQGIYLIKSNEDDSVWVLRSLVEDAEIAVSSVRLTIADRDFFIGSPLPKHYTGREATVEKIIINNESHNKSTLCLKLNIR